MNTVLVVGGACLLIGFGTAWNVQAIRWDRSAAEARAKASDEIAANIAENNRSLVEARAKTEEYRAKYLEQKKNDQDEIDALERRVAAGPERLYIKASCPAVPAAGANASGTGGGTAELDATATSAYFALERGLAEQYGLLQLCRQELRKRSAQKAP